MSSNGQIPTAQVDGLDGALTALALTVQDENVDVASNVNTIDFQGAGVTAAVGGAGEVVVTIPGGSGGGGGSGALTKIAETELAVAASTISFASIAGTYSSLKLVLTGRSSVAAANDGVKLYANGDTTVANYKYKQFYGSTGTSYSAATDSNVGFVPGSTATAGEPGTVEILIPHYAKTTFRKVFQSQFYSPSTPLSGISNTMRLNTAAITDLSLALGTGQFVIGTCATLYGMA